MPKNTKKPYPEIYLDWEKYERLKEVRFVFRQVELPGECVSYSAYIYPELHKPVVTDIVYNPKGGYMWNWYDGCEGQSRQEVARKVLSAIENQEHSFIALEGCPE